jgi:transposase
LILGPYLNRAVSRAFPPPVLGSCSSGGLGVSWPKGYRHNPSKERCRIPLLPLTVIGLEACPLSQWLYAGLTEAGFVTSLMETRHVKAALSATTVKTDRRDARGIAQLLRMGWFRPVHAKSAGSQDARALLVARKQLQQKFRDVERSLRGILRGFGLKVGKVTDKTFEARIRELVSSADRRGHVAARAALLEQFEKLHKAVLKIVGQDEVCRRFMTTPSVGAIVAITYKSALDDPGRIKKSKNAGPLFGLTPKRYQSGETDITGGISRVGDEMVRRALYEAVMSLSGAEPNLPWLPEVPPPGRWMR